MTAPTVNPPPSRSGLRATLHCFVAFDWGDEIDLELARRFAPSELHALPRKPRTPPSIQYRPFPLRFRLDPSPGSLPRIPVTADGPVTADATVFDFGAVSSAFHFPLRLSESELAVLAGSLSESQDVIESARAVLEPLFERLRPAIANARWSELTEEYFVFEFRPDSGLPPPAELVRNRSEWLAGLVRLEADPLAHSEVDEALKSRMSYKPDDLVIADWAGALVIDEHPDEVLELLAFANLQLLEFRQIDHQLERDLETAWHVSRRHAASWLPIWRTHARNVRALGVVKVDAHGVLERTSNILKLVGDPYLARLYQLLVARFHLDEWADDVRHSISLLESVYQVLTQQAGMYRTEFLELMIVLLFVYEVLSSILGG